MHSSAIQTDDAGARPDTVTPLPTPTYYTVEQLVQAEPALGKGAVRHDLFHRETNGLTASGAIVQRGRRILINREKYLAWMVEQAKAEA